MTGRSVESRKKIWLGGERKEREDQKRVEEFARMMEGHRPVAWVNSAMGRLSEQTRGRGSALEGEEAMQTSAIHDSYIVVCEFAN